MMSANTMPGLFFADSPRSTKGTNNTNSTIKGIPTTATWEPLLKDVSQHLLQFLYTNEIVRLGEVSKRLKTTFLAPRFIRASVHETGPSDSARFQFWKKALHVKQVQRDLLFDTFEDKSLIITEEEVEEEGPQKPEGRRRDDTLALDEDGLDEAAYEVFKTVLFGNDQDESHPEGSPRYSGKRMLSMHGQEGEVLRDVARTFPMEPLFRESAGVGQNLLANVLKACLKFHNDVGYCQGMNYVVACFLFSLRRRLLPPSPFNHRLHPHAPHSYEAFSSSAMTDNSFHPPPFSTDDSTNSGNVVTHFAHQQQQSYTQSIPPSCTAVKSQAHGHGSLSPDVPPMHHHQHHQDNHHHHHHHHGEGGNGHYSPSTTTDEEEGYHSDHSTQTQGSENFSPPTYRPSNPPCPEKTALAKKYGFLWECSDEHMHVASEVFWMMTALMSSSSGLSMRLLWHPEVPHMKLRVFQFDRIMATHLPRLHVHFKNIRLAPDILVTQWLMTLLAYCLPLRVLVRVWDVVFLDGWKVLFRICLALLQAVQEDLLPLNLEESGRFLRQWTSQCHPLWKNPELLLRAAKDWKITRSMLQQLTEEFHLTLLKEQLSGGANNGEWLSRYGPGTEGEMLKEPELEGLKCEIRSIEGPVMKDFGHFRKKIEEAGQKHEGASKRVVDLDARLVEVAAQMQELEEAKKTLQVQMEELLAKEAAKQATGNSSSSTSFPALVTTSSSSLSPSTTTTPKSAATSSSSSSSAFLSLLPLGTTMPRSTTATPTPAPTPTTTATPSTNNTPSLASSLIASIREIKPSMTMTTFMGATAAAGAHALTPTTTAAVPLVAGATSAVTASLNQHSQSSSSSISHNMTTVLGDDEDILASAKDPPPLLLAVPAPPVPPLPSSTTRRPSSSRSSSSSTSLTSVSPRERTASEDSCRSEGSASSTRSRRPSMDLQSIGEMITRLVDCLGQKTTEEDGLESTFGSIFSPTGGEKGGNPHPSIDAAFNPPNTASTPTTDSSTSPKDVPAMTMTAMAATGGKALFNKDLFLHERKVNKTEAQLTKLKVAFASLQLERREAEVALEEAEAFRSSLSAQLLQLLQEMEEHVNTRMREVVRSQPSHRSTVPLALSPNKDVLESARTQARLRTSSHNSNDSK